MANLMITKQCNLHCPYCFANEFVNKETDLMSMETFEKCLHFLAGNPEERIGLIGGEPTLHPQFRQFLVRLINSPFRNICLFTNGILLDRYFTELRNGKFIILINLNSPDVVCKATYKKIIDNIDQMINHLYMWDQVGIGLNIYDPEMNVEYLYDVLKQFRFKRVRLSVAVPNLTADRTVDPLEYFHKMKKKVCEIILELLKINVAPFFDCNYLPNCIFTEEDYELFRQYPEVLKRSNLTWDTAICAPVLDILPDLRVVRCFAVSDFYKAYLTDYQNIQELKRHLSSEVDALAYQILPSAECKSCHEYLAGKCSCGCYAYRLKKMQKLRAFIHSEFGERG